MPQEATSVPSGQPAEASPPALPGWNADLTEMPAAGAMDVLERAFDYRGDVTLTLADGRSVTGYLFDRRKGVTLADSAVRLLCPGSDEKVSVRYADVRRVAFDPRDPAAGKSFETWVKKYVEKKLRGERASIESEPLE
jgi:hypothetical protein